MENTCKRGGIKSTPVRAKCVDAAIAASSSAKMQQRQKNSGEEEKKKDPVSTHEEKNHQRVVLFESRVFAKTDPRSVFVENFSLPPVYFSCALNFDRSFHFAIVCPSDVRRVWLNEQSKSIILLA